MTTLNEDNILSDGFLDYLIDTVNDYIEESDLEVDKLDFYFSDKEVLNASDLEALKSKMKEIFSEIEWTYTLESGRELQTKFIQEIVDNIKEYFCRMNEFCIKYNDDEEKVLWVDFLRSDSNLINANIVIKSILNRNRWYRYDNGSRVNFEPDQETIVEDVEAGKGLYVEGVAEKTLKIDLLFLIDNSGSMRSEIDSVKSSIVKIGNYLVDKGADIRFAWCKYINLEYINEIDFTDSFEYLKENISTSFADNPPVPDGAKQDVEASMDALLYTTKDGDFDWRENVNRIVLLCTNEPSNWDEHTPEEVAEYFNDNNFGLIYSTDKHEGKPENDKPYGSEDLVPLLDNAIATDLLSESESAWESVVNWITQLIETETYTCDVTVPDMSCLENLPTLDLSQCSLPFDSLYNRIADSNDIPNDAEICRIDGEE